MYMYLLRYPYLHVLYSLGTTVPTYLQDLQDLYIVQYMNCHYQIQLEVSHVFIVGKFAQMGSVSPL